MTKKLKTRQIGLGIIVAVIVLSFWKFEMISNIIGFLFSLIAPFLLAGAIAFIVNVPMTAIEKMLFRRKKQKNQVSIKISRPISLFLAVIFILSIVIFACFVIIPQVQDTVATLVVKIEAFLPQVENFVEENFQNNDEIITYVDSISMDDFLESLWGYLQTGLLSVFDSTITVASNIVSLITQLFVAVVFAIYILLQKEILTIQFLKVFNAFWSKEKTEKVTNTLSLTKRTFSRFISGQCLEAVILGALFVIVLSLFRIPFALLIGIIVGLSSVIPILGAFFGAGVGAFLIVIENPTQAVYFLIIFLVIQQIEGNLIYPRVVGDSIGLPAMWVLAAVSIGGSLLGVLGILLCIPLSSVAYALFRDYVTAKLKEKELQVEIETN